MSAWSRGCCRFILFPSRRLASTIAAGMGSSAVADEHPFRDIAPAKQQTSIKAIGW